GKIAKGGIKGSKGFFSKAGDSIKSGWNKVKSVFKKSDEVTQSFENKEILVDHFTRHGSKMGYTSPSTYEKDARNFLSGKPQLNTAEMIRSSDKALVRYQFNTQKLGVLDADGTTIKTFLKPYDDPIESYNYYLKQINKR
ncbi:hypothetical protein HYT54_05115, partial [Candidatus Woesearchaeota archaeon]|nr:hypothetical protein [Candidatus Woesearchaeota archaeon]